jgi:hypothetical protein
MQNLESCRQKIDEIDGRLVDLIEQGCRRSRGAPRLQKSPPDAILHAGASAPFGARGGV